MCVAEFLDLQGLSYLKLARLGRVESLDSHTALRLPMADDADSEIEVEETEGNPLDPAFCHETDMVPHIRNSEVVP